MTSPVVTRETPHLETSKVRFKRILVATDFSAVAEKALDSAITLSQQFSAELYIANVIFPVVYPDRPDLVGPTVLDAEESAAWTAMQRVTDKPGLRGLQHKELVRFGPVGIELVVVGTHAGTGLEKILLGSVAESLLRECRCPVLVVGPRARTTNKDFASILFATALTTDSLRANQYAVALAEQANAKITLLHVVEQKTPPDHAIAVDIRRALLKRVKELVPEDVASWCTPKFRVEYGKPSMEVTRAAHDVRADLIVLSAHDSQALSDHAPWATVSKIIAKAPCPVLVVRAHFNAVQE
jgi:nucleotide-binding universal stress UspA family protein